MTLSHQYVVAGVAHLCRRRLYCPSVFNAKCTCLLLFIGEEDTLDMDLTEESPPRNMVQTNISHSISNFNINKPLSIHNMKELQNISKHTVNHAKHKIGDLQVCH